MTINEFDKTVYHGVDRQTMKSWLRNQCSPMKGRHGYVIGPDVNGRLSHCSTHFTLAEAVRKAKELNHGEPHRGETFEASADPKYAVTVYSDMRYGLRGAGYFFHPIDDKGTPLSVKEISIRGGSQALIEELKAIGNYVAWGK